MNDNELIDELRDLLIHESSAVRAPSDLAARSRALHHRRRARLAVAGAVPAVATGAVLARSPSSRRGTRPSQRRVTPRRQLRLALRDRQCSPSERPT